MNASRLSPVDAVPPTDGPSRYDLYLALLPVPLLVGAVMALALPVPVSYGAGAGALPSALVLGYGLFRDAPTRAVESGMPVRRGAPSDDD